MIEKFTISRDDSVYECFPDVCMTQTGKLVLTYRESDSHGASDYSYLLYRVSEDAGATWSDKVYLDRQEKTGGVLFKWNCPRVSQLSDGRIIILCDGYPVPPGEGGSQYDSKQWLWISEDDAASFAEAVETPVCGIVPDKIIELNSGRLLLGSHVRDDELGGLYRQMVHISDDGAESWRGPITVCCTHHYEACEGGIVQLPEGELVCYMRDNSRTGRPGPKCISKDEGESWLGPFDTLMNGLHRPAVGLTNPTVGQTPSSVREAGLVGQTPSSVREAGLVGQTPSSVREARLVGQTPSSVREARLVGQTPSSVREARLVGQTPSSVREARLVGQTPSPVPGDPEVMITYRFHPGGPFAKNFFAYKESIESALEPDRSKQSGIILPLDHDRNAQSDSSYSGWVHLPDGRFFAVNYIKDDAPMAQIRGYYWTEDEF